MSNCSATKKMIRNEVDNLKPYIPGKPLEEIKRVYGLTDIVKLASNENPLGPSKLAIQAIKEEAAGIHLYSDPVATRLREALAEQLGVDPDEIFVGNGGDEVLRMLAMTFVNAGDEAVMATPSFSTYEISVHHMGGIPVMVPLKPDYSYDVDAMVRAVTDRTKLMYLCSPNNPTGNIITRSELDRLVAAIPEHVILVLDEAYFEYARQNPDYHDGVTVFKCRPNTVVLRTFSKVSGLAGIRVGYCVTSKELTRELGKVKFVFNVSSVAQAAGIAALKDTDHIEQTVDLNRRSLSRMAAYFESKNWNYVKTDANFIFVDTGVDARELFEKLLERGVAIRPGYIWKKDTCIRVSSGTMEQTETFITELEGILNARD